MSDLPTGWAMTRLDHCSENLDSSRVPVNASERATREGEVPYYGATGRVGWIDRPLFNEELVLLGEDGAPFLERHRPKAYLINGPSWVNNHAHVLRGRGVSNRYLMHFLNSIDYHGLANGTTRLKLTQASMNSIGVHVAPRREQDRIVAAIEEHFSRLDAGLAALNRARQNLKRMRVAVLEKVATLPEGDVIPLGALVDDVRTGLDRGRAKQRGGPPGHGYVKMGDVQDGSIDLRHLAYIDATHDEIERFELVDGDVLFNNRNSHELVGKSGIVRSPQPGTLYNNNLVRLRASTRILPEFLALQMSAQTVRSQLNRMKSATTNVAAIYTRDLMTLSLSVPTIEVQRTAIGWATDALGNIDRVSELVMDSARRNQTLRSGILAAAFSGRLVPQALFDERASILNERIADERASNNGEKGSRLTGRKPLDLRFSHE
jgi:type I restriction enzyme, S subunit